MRSSDPPYQARPAARCCSSLCEDEGSVRGRGEGGRSRMPGARIAVPLGLAVVLGVAALSAVPRGYEAQALLAAADDPVALADHAVARSLNTAAAEHQINDALAANDADLAQSFLDLARDENVPVDPALAEKVGEASAEAAGVSHSLGGFAPGWGAGET